jgi:hypothetical protein
VTRRDGTRIEFRSALGLAETIAILDSDVAPRSRFAADLVRQSHRGLSQTQWAWARYLAQEHLDKRANPAPAAPAPADRIDDLSRVYGLFATARQQLKHPKIRIETADGRPVVMNVAERGRHPGSVIVTSGAPFGTPGSFYGYVHPTGETTIHDRGVQDALTAFAADPAGVAARYGRCHDECCFCGRALSNGEAGSVSVGYGPICAERYGLPWQPNKASHFDATEDSPIPVTSVS